MQLTKKKTAILALALIALVATVSAGYFIISDYIHKEAALKRPKGLEITVTDFPEEIEIGKNYTFNTTTENVLDQELKDLYTYTKIWMVNTTLEAEWFHVYYEDSTWAGELIFAEQPDGSLLCTIGPWTAPIGYYMEAEITFLVDATSDPEALPEGTINMDIWVESPSFP